MSRSIAWGGDTTRKAPVAVVREQLPRLTVGISGDGDGDMEGEREWRWGQGWGKEIGVENFVPQIYKLPLSS